MDCVGKLEHINNIIIGSNYDLHSIFRNIMRGFDQDYNYLRLVLSDLIQALNDIELIECLNMLRYNSTTPNVYDILSFLLVKPDERDIAFIHYRKLGLSDTFIDTLFYKSGRPRTDMSKYYTLLNLAPKFLPKTPFFIADGVTSDDVLIDGQHPILPFPYTNIKHRDDVYYVSNMINNNIYPDCIIPVIRYQVGMHGYLTVQKGGTEYCGTFYYFEPDSEYKLYSPFTLVAINKITACLVLGMDINFIVDILIESKGNWVVGEDPDPIVDGYPNHMGFTVAGKTKWDQWYNLVLGFYNGTINPMIHYHHMYALEDNLDQRLCIEAKNAGISCVLLQYMTGETRVVTEVLDTRSRTDSFNNLYFPTPL